MKESVAFGVTSRVVIRCSTLVTLFALITSARSSASPGRLLARQRFS